MAAFEGRGTCEGCCSPVEVYSDRNGLAYYKCGPCGRKVTHSKAANSRKFLATIDRHADEDAAPENQAVPNDQKPPLMPPHKSGKTQEKPAFRLFGK